MSVIIPFGNLDRAWTSTTPGGAQTTRTLPFSWTIPSGTAFRSASFKYEPGDLHSYEGTHVVARTVATVNVTTSQPLPEAEISIGPNSPYTATPLESGLNSFELDVPSLSTIYGALSGGGNIKTYSSPSSLTMTYPVDVVDGGYFVLQPIPDGIVVTGTNLPETGLVEGVTYWVEFAVEYEDGSPVEGALIDVWSENLSFNFPEGNTVGSTGRVRLEFVWNGQGSSVVMEITTSPTEAFNTPYSSVELPIDGADPTPVDETLFHVYELDRGWSFDGAYIPHYIEMNWYFGDDPIHYHSVQKIRIHGMSKGLAQLTVATNGMQTDYERDFSEPQIVDLPRSPKHISTELLPETNYTDSANRGLSIQMKFEGRNRDLTKPEPQHVLQVLAVQSSPAGTGSRSN